MTPGTCERRQGRHPSPSALRCASGRRCSRPRARPARPPAAPAPAQPTGPAAPRRRGPRCRPGRRRRLRPRRQRSQPWTRAPRRARAAAARDPDTHSPPRKRADWQEGASALQLDGLLAPTCTASGAPHRIAACGHVSCGQGQDLRRVCLSARHPRQPEWVRCARSRYPHSWASRGASPQRAEPHGRCSPRRRPHRRPRPRPPRLPLALPSHRPMPRPQTLPQGLSDLQNPAGWARRGRTMRRRAAAEHPRCQGPLQRPLLGRRGSAERAPPARANRWARHQRRRGRRRWRTGPRPALTGTRPTRCAKRSATRAASAPPRLPRRPPLSSLRAGKLVTLCMHHQVDERIQVLLSVRAALATLQTLLTPTTGLHAPCRGPRDADAAERESGHGYPAHPGNTHDDLLPCHAHHAVPGAACAPRQPSAPPHPLEASFSLCMQVLQHLGALHTPIVAQDEQASVRTKRRNLALERRDELPSGLLARLVGGRLGPLGLCTDGGPLHCHL